MEVKVKKITDWERVVNAARFTAHKEELGHEPSDQWKKKIALSEHSPFRLLEFDIQLADVPYYVVMHLVRHFMGVEKFVTTQREDRTTSGTPRSELKQDALVGVQFSANAQALINISRKRLCLGQPSPETRMAWTKVKEAIAEVDPVMASAMRKECVYRGRCPEAQCCGYDKTEVFQNELKEYWKV